MSSEFSLTFFGVRGSYPVPGETTRRYGGNTSSLLLEVDGRPVILDAGTGIIQAGRYLRDRLQPGQAVHIFLTHLHSDHIMGLPFFDPMFDPRAEIVVHYLEMEGTPSQAALEALFQPPYSPITLKGVKARLRFNPLASKSGEMRLEGALDVAYLLNDSHPRMGVLIYRIRVGGRTVVYATDIESPAGFDDGLRGFVAGADVLIHDSQYFARDYFNEAKPRTGFGHSTVAMAAANAAACGVKRLFLFHFDPKYTDAMLEEMLVQARATFPDTALAQEGEKITIRR